MHKENDHSEGICFQMDDLSWDEAQGYCDSLNVFSDEDLYISLYDHRQKQRMVELISDNAATNLG